MLRLVSLPVWHGLSPGRLQLELAAQPPLAKRWKALLKKEAKAAKAAAKGAAPAAEGVAAAPAELPRAESAFVPGMLAEFLACLARVDELLAGDTGGASGAAASSAVAVEYEEAAEEDEEAGGAEDRKSVV